MNKANIPGKSIASASLLVLVLALASQQAAAAAYCGMNPTNGEGLSKDDMTFNALAADDCYGVVMDNNDSAADINALANWYDPTQQWALLAKSDDPATNTVSGIQFTLTATVGKSGSWTLTAFDTNGMAYANLPVAMDFVGVLKGSDRYAVYYFDNELVGGSNSGTWEISYLNKGGNVPNLSHLSLYTRVDEGGGIPASIPEAQTWAMMLAGLGLVGFMARRGVRSPA